MEEDVVKFGVPLNCMWWLPMEEEGNEGYKKLLPGLQKILQEEED